jgi:hypothetical protein
MSYERVIILHYHLFKNAGTSVDAMLKENFVDRWVTREFPGMNHNNTALVEEWIRETPQAVAYSSHTMMGPIPKVEGVKIISLLLLRDPIERIKSAYRFERTQQADTWGAQLAKQHDWAGYVRARLDRLHDRQCRNFQTERLASLVPGPEPELDRAKQALKNLTWVGRVEHFDEAMSALAETLHSDFPEATVKTEWRNRSEHSALASDPALKELLVAENMLDYELIKAV